MAVAFPSSPNPGDRVLDPTTGVVWRWDGIRWTFFPGSRRPATVTVSETAPVDAEVTDLWLDSKEVNLYIRYQDQNLVNWVPVVNVPQLQRPFLEILPAAGRLQTASQTSLEFVPMNGRHVRINGNWYPIPASGVTSAPWPPAVVNAAYWIYIFDNAGTLALEFSQTDHQPDTSEANYGTEIKQGDPTRTLVGLVYIQSDGFRSGLDAEDYVRSWPNRVPLAFNASGTVNFANANVAFNALWGMAFADEIVDLTAAWYGTGDVVMNGFVASEVLVYLMPTVATATGHAGHNSAISTSNTTAKYENMMSRVTLRLHGDCLFGARGVAWTNTAAWCRGIGSTAATVR